MSTHYSARIIENDTVTQAQCYADKPADAMRYLNLSKDATVQLACSYWEGDTYVSAIYTYCYMPELDEEGGSAWEIVGADYVRHFVVEVE